MTPASTRLLAIAVLVTGAVLQTACSPAPQRADNVIARESATEHQTGPADAPLAAPAQGATVADWTGVQQIAQAFASRRSGVLVAASGTVVRILPDDLDPPRHQKFLVNLANGQTLLISRNIDLAPRINNLQENSTVAFSGQYEWNDKGGVVHWTHHDPNGVRAGGWIQCGGYIYR